MNWSEIFPVLTTEMVEDYNLNSTRQERLRYENWLGVERVHEGKRGVKSKKTRGPLHIVSATLFWKHVMSFDVDLPTPCRERMVMAKRMGLVRRFQPWESYVEPLLRYSGLKIPQYPEVTFRLYLAHDLEFLVTDFTELGWDVCLMKSSSERYCPGGFWRFLAFGEKNAVITSIDTDRMGDVDGEIARTQLMQQRGLGLWRVPGYYAVDNEMTVDRIRYRPILGGHFGGKAGLPIRQLIEATIWHTEHGTMPLKAKVPGRGEMPINYTQWPDYGFDEWFQLAALYPRMAQRGTLTFVPTAARSFFLPIDIEYVTWANRRSEMVYF